MASRPLSLLLLRCAWTLTLLTAPALLVPSAAAGPKNGLNHKPPRVLSSERICAHLLEVSLADPQETQTIDGIFQKQLRQLRIYDWLQKQLGRNGASLEETIRKNAVARVKVLLATKQHDHEIARALEPIFKPALDAYFKAERAAGFLKLAREYRDRLAPEKLDEMTEGLLRFNQALPVLGITEMGDLRPAIRAGDIEAIQRMLSKTVPLLRKATLYQGRRVAATVDEYTAIYNYLQTLASKATGENSSVVKQLIHPPEEVPGYVGMNRVRPKNLELEVAFAAMPARAGASRELIPQDAEERASKVLELLQPAKILGLSLRKLKDNELARYPHLDQFYALMKRFPEIELSRMRELINREALDLLLAVELDGVVIDLALAGIRKIASLGMISETSASKALVAQLREQFGTSPNEKDLVVQKLRAAWRTLRDQRLYQMEITDIAHSVADGATRLNELLRNNAGTDEAFMVLFARIQDREYRDAWKEIKAAAAAEEAHLTAKPIVARLEAAEAMARSLGDIAVDSSPPQVNVVRWALKWLAVGVGGYFTYQSVVPGEKGSPEKAEGVHLPKEQASPEAMDPSKVPAPGSETLSAAQIKQVEIFLEGFLVGLMEVMPE